MKCPEVGAGQDYFTAMALICFVFPLTFDSVFIKYIVIDSKKIPRFVWDL